MFEKTKMTKKELVALIIKNFADEDNSVDLEDLNFGDMIVFLSGMKAKEIYQSSHTATEIYQDYHTADTIYQSGHKANRIYQKFYDAKNIIQDDDD